MSYDPYSLFGQESAEVEKAPTVSSEPVDYDPNALFGSEPEAPVAAPTAAPAPSITEQVGIQLPTERAGTGTAEAALSMLSSAVAQPLSGLVGIGASLYGGAEAGAEAVKATQEALTFQPRTEAGREAMESVGAFIAPIADAITGTSEFLGDTAESLGASPAVSTFMYTLPEAALTVLPAGAGVKAARAAKLERASEATRVRTEILRTDPDARLSTSTGANWKLDQSGVAVPNEAGRLLVKKEVARPSDAALITNSDVVTKSQMRAMTEAFNKTAKGEVSASPSQIIGQNAGRALKEVNDARKKVGQQLDDLVKGPVGNTPVDIKPVMSQFYAELSSRGIKPAVDMNTGKAYLDFRGSALDFASYKGIQKLLNDGFQMTTYRGKPTLADAHKMKRALDDLLDAKKLEQGGNLGNIERILADVRTGLNKASQQVDGYGELNARYSSLRDSLDSFGSYKPAGMSWDSPKVMNNVGAAMKSAASDTAAMNNMIESLGQASRTMQQVGAKPFSVDVYGLARYNDFLNSQFQQTLNATAPKVGRAILNNLSGAAISGAVGNKFGVANNSVGLVRNAADMATYQKVLAANRNSQRLVLNALKN